jgi:hypothetical protein
VNSPPHKWISRATKQLAMIIVSPVLVYAVIVPVCWSWSQTLKPGTTNGSFFDWCGHDAILPTLVLGSSIVLAFFCLLAIPISLLLDWRKWKKSSL